MTRGPTGGPRALEAARQFSRWRLGVRGNVQDGGDASQAQDACQDGPRPPRPGASQDRPGCDGQRHPRGDQVPIEEIVDAHHHQDKRREDRHPPSAAAIRAPPVSPVRMRRTSSAMVPQTSAGARSAARPVRGVAPELESNTLALASSNPSRSRRSEIGIAAIQVARP
jgi:hypothetical protein